MEARRVLESFPLPFSRGYRRFWNAVGIRERHDAAYYLYEVYLKYLASIAISEYLANDAREHRVNAALKGLARPTLGEWVRFLRECLSFLAGTTGSRPSVAALSSLYYSKERQWSSILRLYNSIAALAGDLEREKDRISLKMLLGAVVAYRNRVLGHGAPLGDGHYEEFGEIFGQAFGELLDHSEFLAERRLVCFRDFRIRERGQLQCEVIEFMGLQPLRRQAPLVLPYGAPHPREGALYLLDAGGGFLSLDPLLVAREEDVYILNEAGDSPEYLSYSTGERFRPSSLARSQGDLFERILGYPVDARRLTRIGEDVSRTQGDASGSPDRNGKRLGDYRIVREVGRGGMGSVFEAVQETLGRRVALKVLPGTFALDSRRLERFYREARATAKIHHPNIVPVYEVGETGGTHFYAMEFIEGESLQQVLDRTRGGPIARRAPGPGVTPDAAAVAGHVERLAAVADGLERAHRLGLVHRDIKPSNILVGPDGHYILVDFGLVQEREAQAITQSGEVLGTLNYMSPEQVARTRVDARTDIYSLCVTLYEALTLELPFRAESDHELQRAILFDEPTPPRRLNRRISRDLETILLRGMEKNPGRRYASAGELVEDLRRSLRGEPVLARPRGPISKLARRVWRRRGALLAGSGFALALCVTALLLHGEYRERVRRMDELYEGGIRDAVMLMHFGRPCQSPSPPAPDPEHEWALPTAAASERAVDDEGEGAPVREALARLDGLARLVPSRPEAHYYRVRALSLLRRDEEAREELAAVLRGHSGFAPARTLAHILCADLADDSRRRWMERLGVPGDGKADPWARHWLEAQAAAAHGRWKEAVQAYTKIIDLGGDEPYLGASLEVRLGRGRASLEAWNHYGAIEDFSEARALWKGALVPVLLLAKAYYLHLLPERADEHLERLHATSAYPGEVALRAADLFHELEDWGRGLEWARKMEAGSRAEVKKADFLRHLGRLDEALATAEKAKALRNDWEAHRVLGLIHKQAGRLDEAETEYREAALAAPGESGLRFNLANTLVALGRVDEAIKEYEDAARLAPRDPVILLNLSMALHEAGRVEEALAQLERARSLPLAGADIHASLGGALRRARRLDEALEHLSTATHLAPRNAAHRAGLAKVLQERRELERAAGELEKAIELEPEEHSHHESLASVLEEEEKLEQALVHYDKAIALKQCGAAHEERATLLARLKRFPEARAGFEEAIKLNPRSASAYSRRAGLWVDLGEREKALADHEEAIKLAPRSAREHSNYGAALDDMGRPRDALPFLRKAVELDRLDATAVYNLGVVLEKIGEAAEATQCFEKALELDPKLEHAHLHLGNLHLERGELREAAARYEKAVACNPRSVMSLHNLGLAQEKLGLTADALKSHRRAVEIQPLNPDSHNRLGLLLMELDDLEDAEKAFRKAIELDSSYPRAYANLSLLLEKTGRDEDAMALLREVLRIVPDYAVARNNLGTRLLDDDKLDEAIVELKKAVEARPGYVKALYNLARAFEKKGSLDDARKAARQGLEAIAKDPQSHASPPARPEFLVLLADVERKAGRPEEARAQMQAGLEAMRAAADRPDAGASTLNACAWQLLTCEPSCLRDADGALEYARRAAEKSGWKDADLLDTLALAHFRKGQLEEAVRVQEKAVDVSRGKGSLERTLDRYRKALLPGVASYASVDIALDAPEELLARGAEWSFFRGRSEPPAGWMGPGFDDGGWAKGRSPLGHGEGWLEVGTVIDDMRDRYTTLYIRHVFDVPESRASARYVLSIEADDGFVAWLDGKEVGRARAGEAGSAVPFDGVADENVTEPVEPVMIPIRLEPGRHVLAIQGLNRSLDSSDFTLVPSILCEGEPLVERDARRRRAMLEAPVKEPVPRSLAAYFEGRLLERRGDHAGARSLYEEVLRLDGARPEPFLRLAETLRVLGDLEAAETTVRDGLRRVDGGAALLRDLWIRIVLVDRERSAPDALSTFPEEREAGGREGAGLRWVLERLAAGGPVRIRCGAREDAEVDGEAWGMDRFHRGGKAYGPLRVDIEGTDRDGLYQSGREFSRQGAAGYRIPLPPGSYRITLHAEIQGEDGKERSFTVLAEGAPFLSARMPPARGPRTARSESRVVPVKDGFLDVDLVEKERPRLCAIEIVPER